MKNLPLPRKLLTISDLCISFSMHNQTVKAVQHATLHLRKGESVAIVGESGCGKTTLARSILGLNPSETTCVSSGSIQYKGKDLLTLPENELRAIRGRDIAMIFQDPMSSLNPTMKIGQQIRECLLLHHADESSKKNDARLLALLKRVGISEPHRRQHLYPFELSGGMRQRVMIAMALAADPEILICDEATTSLDVTIQAQILNQLKLLQEEMGMTILFITHNLALVAGFCSRILVMYGGTIVETAPTDILFDDPKHPYTKRLLASIPTIDATKTTPLLPIGGDPPSPFEQISGCAFHPRCPYATKECTEKLPPYTRYGESMVACYHPHTKKRFACPTDSLTSVT